MSYTKTELQNLSKLLLSVDDTNVDLAFVLIDQGGVTKELITELFAIYKLGNREHSHKAKVLLLTCVEESEGLQHIINRKSYLNGSSPRKKIKSFAGDCPDLDPMKLALALYNKYGEGLQYLVSELPEMELKDLLIGHLEGTTFKLTRKKITKIPPHIFKDYIDLEVLDLTHNQIKTLPAGIGKLAALKSIDLSYNKLTKVNKSIGKLLQLEELRLNHNNIKELPSEIGGLVQLRILELERINDIGFPSLIAALPNLEELVLTYSSYSPGVIDSTFFNLKTNKLTRLKFDDYGVQTKWTNLPAFSEVTGTYEDPIDTNPLPLARRAYIQKGECLEYLLEHAPPNEVKELLKPYLKENNTIFTLEKVRLSCFPKELLNYNIREWRGNALQLINIDIWEGLTYMPNLEVIDLGMGTQADFWGYIPFPIQYFQQLEQLKVLNLGTVSFDHTLEHLHKLSQLEEFWMYEYLNIDSAEKLGILDKYSVLKKLPNLRKFVIRGISNSYYNEPEKAREIKKLVAAYISQWLPKECEVIVGSNDSSQL
jgi:hypothetical protein